MGLLWVMGDGGLRERQRSSGREKFDLIKYENSPLALETVRLQKF